MNSYDIVIVGGGMVGATLAAALADTDIKILVLDTSQPTAPSKTANQFDLRVSAITRASERIFRSVGVWSEMESFGISPFREMRVWDALGGGRIHFDCAEIGEPTLGYIVENRVIQWTLWEKLGKAKNIHIQCPAQLDYFVSEPDRVDIFLQDDTRLSTKLLVGADGKRSGIRAAAGITVHGWDYQQTAVVATVKPSEHHHDTAWQRFLETGPLAFLPLQKGYCSIVWSTTPEMAASLVEMDADLFCEELQIAFDSTLGRIESVGERASFPLNLQHATQYVQSRLALIGDAAHAIHPLAGQGVNLGLLDAASLAEVVVQAHNKHRDIGDYTLLRRYERWRKGDNLTSMFTMDGFKRLFGNQLPIVMTARNTGMNMVDRLPAAKKMIMRQAMGLIGDLPAMARASETADTFS